MPPIDGAGPGGVSPERNLLLASWPGALPAALHLMSVERGQTLQRAGSVVDMAYFPVTTVLAVAVGADGADDPVEVHHLGREGAAGVCVTAGDSTSGARITCAVAGAVWALPAADLIAAADGDQAVMKLVQRFVQALARHLAQRVACRATHTNEQRFAAAVLTTTWQTGGGDTIMLTQADLARMLLVRRATVSTAATRLSDAGAIRYRYGTITIADHDALQAAACECHRVTHAAYLAVGVG
ncbi:Crp/Fnr family transcriptional regulator [Jatrophihabitans sp. YIM 134969]